VLWAVDRAGARLHELATLLGGDLPVRARRGDDDGPARRRRPIDRDTALEAIGNGTFLRKHLDQLGDPDAHVVTVSISRVGHGRGAAVPAGDVHQPPGSVAWMARLFHGARWLGGDQGTVSTWFDAGAVRLVDGTIRELTDVALLGRPVAHAVLVLRDLLLRPALAAEHGSHVFRSLAGEPEIVRVEILPGARDPRQQVLAHQRALAAFDDAVDRGGAGELPPNPESLLPVVRNVGWSAPLRVGESWKVDLEDFVTGWSPSLEVPSVRRAIEIAWWLRWSAL
jgi:hypothetical protein